jgi:energy-coupling factor transporter ATP-binding protein EcfA2
MVASTSEAGALIVSLGQMTRCRGSVETSAGRQGGREVRGMKLTKFQVHRYKGVIDSGPVAVEPLTVLVGKNESGKTTLLKALHKLNPATPEPYEIEREWPRGRRTERRTDHVVCSARFELSGDETAKLSEVVEPKTSITSVDVTRDYAGRLEVVFPEGLIPDKLHPNEVDRLCELLPPPPAEVSGPFRACAEERRGEVRRLVDEGRLSELGPLVTQQVQALQAAINPAQPHQPHDQAYQAQYAAKLQELVQKVPTVPSMRKQAHEYVVRRLPKFIYMDDYRTFKGKALLDQVKQRRDQKTPQEDDDTFLMILKLSGLQLDDLVARGQRADRELRQYDLDDGGRTLTRTFSERLKQREYEVQFRADGQEFYTMVKDQTDVGLIRLEERSKGFQWFFSFDLLFMHESGGTFENCVLLLDEPGLHLHPGAQKDLLARLEEYAKGNTLIYSTHLPFMLDLHHPERIRVINDSKQGAVVTEDLTLTQPDGKLTLQAALGMSSSQSYLVAQRNIVVEGADDYMLINELSNLLLRSGEDGLPEDVHVTAAGGASEAAYIATFMIGQQLDVVVLLDSDQAGEVARDKLVKSWLTRYKGKPTQVLHLAEAVGATAREFSIEDLFPDDYYLARVTEIYGKQLVAAGAPPEPKLLGDGQLCKRVERALSEHGVTFNKGSVAKRIRRDLSRMNDASKLPPQTKTYATKLVAALTKALQ